MTTFKGEPVTKNIGHIKIGIVVSRTDKFTVSRLLSKAMIGLIDNGVKRENVHVAWTPDIFGIPLIASKMAKSGKYDALICLGVILKRTDIYRYNYKYAYYEIRKKLDSISAQNCLPVMFAVEDDDIDPLHDIKERNKGFICALKTIEMITLMEKFIDFQDE